MRDALSLRERKDRDARLEILQALERETGGHLNSQVLGYVLHDSGGDWSPEYVGTQLNLLAQIGAVRLEAMGERHVIAHLTDSGELHLKRGVILDGVSRPPRGA